MWLHRFFASCVCGCGCWGGHLIWSLEFTVFFRGFHSENIINLASSMRKPFIRILFWESSEAKYFIKINWIRKKKEKNRGKKTMGREGGRRLCRQTKEYNCNAGVGFSSSSPLSFSLSLSLHPSSSSSSAIHLQHPLLRRPLSLPLHLSLHLECRASP